ncbi:neuferricin-like [Elysia marginata]|uniref:Neuferricin-like n=1 Tax=Elysia marginata TaxID=1093978 RepID=A0AAV4FFS0_9GAST|nr:neuferricin-like [Elysia marginata]
MKGNIALTFGILFCIFAYLYDPKTCRTYVRALLRFVNGGEEHSDDRLKLTVTVFSREELSKYKGMNGGDVYLALLGNVYDVTRGRKHYGPGGGYSFFSGIDGSAAFVTGEFNEKGLVDDISKLSNQDILGLEEWKSFYEKDYKFVGIVEGSFYDKEGNVRDMMRIYKKKLEDALLEKDLLDSDRQLFPSCNSEWAQNKGGRVWCSTKSGGISRDWVGVPRMYYATGSSKARCACVRTSGPPSYDPQSTSHKDRGDLDNPNLSLYPNCNADSISCPLPKK